MSPVKIFVFTLEKYYFFLKLDKVVELVGEGSVFNGAYLV